eukprot:1456019-Pyramimonas_sp.AAC.1
MDANIPSADDVADDVAADVAAGVDADVSADVDPLGKATFTDFAASPVPPHTPGGSGGTCI